MVLLTLYRVHKDMTNNNYTVFYGIGEGKYIYTCLQCSSSYDAYACPLAPILADSEPLVTYFAFACIQFAFGMCSLSLAFSFLSYPGIPRTRKRHARRHRSTYHPLQPRNLTKKHVACPTIPSVTTSFDRATPGNNSINTAPRTRRLASVVTAT